MHLNTKQLIQNYIFKVNNYMRLSSQGAYRIMQQASHKYMEQVQSHLGVVYFSSKFELPRTKDKIKMYMEIPQFVNL